MYKDIAQEPLLGLSAVLQAWPEHEHAEAWREVLRRHAQDYLARLAKQNHFRVVPYGLYHGEDPGGDRQVGEGLWYRYFLVPEAWHVGVNAHVAAAGIGLKRAGRMLEEPELAALGQRQLDWILGFNPLNRSTVVGVGHNQPPRYVNTIEFAPPTPRLVGAVMNGLSGTRSDMPKEPEGGYHTSEYWTPMVAHTLWLSERLSAR